MLKSIDSSDLLDELNKIPRTIIANIPAKAENNQIRCLKEICENQELLFIFSPKNFSLDSTRDKLAAVAI